MSLLWTVFHSLWCSNNFSISMFDFDLFFSVSYSTNFQYLCGFLECRVSIISIILDLNFLCSALHCLLYDFSSIWYFSLILWSCGLEHNNLPHLFELVFNWRRFVSYYSLFLDILLGLFFFLTLFKDLLAAIIIISVRFSNAPSTFSLFDWLSNLEAGNFLIGCVRVHSVCWKRNSLSSPQI